MTRRPAAFAIPGDIATLTGGYIYERRLLEGLRAEGRDVAHIELGASFPEPTPEHLADAARRLVGIDPEWPLILDGLVFGSIDTDVLAQVRAPVVAMIHHPLAYESGLSPGRRNHLYRTERDNLALAAHVLVPSPHTAALLRSDYGVAAEAITIARPGTDRPTGKRAPVDPPMILSVGIQHPRKGHDILLRALGHLKGRDWQAVIVGKRHDPAHASELERLRQELGLEARVRIAGQLPADALSRLWDEAAIFALATRYEGYGIVFDEAMAHGLPMVTCRTGAVPETVAEGAGLLVPPDDVDGFASALDRLLSDTELRARMAAVSSRAGAALPTWPDTARIAGQALDTLPDRGPRAGGR